MKQRYLVLPQSTRRFTPGQTDSGERGEYAWVPIDGEARARWQYGDIENLAKSVNNESLLIVAEIEDFHFVNKAIPGKSRQQVTLAARYSLEDDIASDIDAVEVFVSERQSNGEYTVVIVESNYLNRVLGPLAEKGLNIAQLIPDAMLLDGDDNSLGILLDGERALFKYGARRAAATALSTAPILLNKLKRQEEFEGGVCRITKISSENTIAEGVLDKVRESLATLSFEISESNDSYANFLFRAVQSKQSPLDDLDLVPQRYKQQINTARRKLLWRFAAGIALVALLVQLGADWWHIERTESALKTTREAQQQVVKHSFPEIGRLVNAEAQVKRSLAALEQSGPPPAEFLTILSRSLAVPTRESLGIDLIGMTFADGVLLLRTESKEMGHLEEYRAGLNEHLNAEVVSAEASDNAVRGAIRITAK